jgi:hypothetical protein
MTTKEREIAYDRAQRLLAEMWKDRTELPQVLLPTLVIALQEQMDFCGGKAYLKLRRLANRIEDLIDTEEDR